MMKFQRYFTWAVLASEFSHVFCCVLPTVFTVASLAVNIGLISAAPTWLNDLHHHIHDYEIPIIAFSGVMLALGWLAHSASRKTDCHNTGCVHPPCDNRKTINFKILIAASILFTVNITIFFVIHENIFSLVAFN